MLSEMAKSLIETAHHGLCIAVNRAKMDKCDPEEVANLESLCDEVGKLY